MSRFALLREQGTCSLTYTKIIEIPLCERWVPVRGGCPGTWGTYVLDMVLPCLPAGQYPCPRTRYSTYRACPCSESQPGMLESPIAPWLRSSRRYRSWMHAQNYTVMDTMARYSAIYCPSDFLTPLGTGAVNVLKAIFSHINHITEAHPPGANVASLVYSIVSTTR